MNNTKTAIIFPQAIVLLCLFLLHLPVVAAGSLPDKNTQATTHTPVYQKKQNGTAARLDSAFLQQYIRNEAEYRHQLSLVKKFYKDRDYALAWFRNGKPVPQAEKLIEVLEKARHEGLNPKDYTLHDLRGMIRDYEQANAAGGSAHQKQQEADVALTASYFNYASDFYKGAVNPHSTAAIEWQVKRNKIKLNKALETILQERESSYPYYEFEALHEGYQKLREALVQYRSIQEKGGWPKVEPRTKEEHVVQFNDTAAVVLALRKRLLPGQQLNEQDTTYMVYDRQVEDAVKKWQARHGLTVDGIAGPQTFKALNISVDERIEQIVLNMERWRWLPKRLVPKGKPDRYVMVNIPAFRVTVMENGEEVMRMKAVVGKTMHSTPVFSHEIDYLTFSPYWNVPNSIVEDDIKPKLQRNRNWLVSQNMEMVTTFGANARRVPVNRVNWNTMTRHNFKYRIRQRPGPYNSLGRVKFMFPNEYAVYLHDTPANHLFNETDRDFSHGCVRVERPADLATYLLQDKAGWDKSRVLSAMNGSQEMSVSLEESVPVYLLYFTAWVENDGSVHFRDDLYGHDNALAQQIF